jgi:dTDP-4-amino-4,6-dideoxygalactose transaminase
MPDICAAIGLAQIRKYEDVILEERKRVFDFYGEEFKTNEWAELPPYDKTDCRGSYHLYPLRIKNITEEQRDKIIDVISSHEVAVNVHFIPLPMLTVFKQQGFKIEDFPVTFNAYSREISLPIYPQLNNNMCLHIVNTVRNAVSDVISDGYNKSS